MAGRGNRVPVQRAISFPHRGPARPGPQRVEVLLECPEPLVAGAGDGEPVQLIAEREGDGLIVRFANNPLFRAFWRGTERLFINALYFGQVVKDTDLPKVVPPPLPEEPRD